MCTLANGMYAIFSTAIGIKCTDGIIMGVEKTLLSKMLVPGTHRRVYAIDRHVGLVCRMCVHSHAPTFKQLSHTLSPCVYS